MGIKSYPMSYNYMVVQQICIIVPYYYTCACTFQGNLEFHPLEKCKQWTRMVHHHELQVLITPSKAPGCYLSLTMLLFYKHAFL